ncbi:MAG: hypothetical protein P8M78_06910 [Myxococcota bacterium]|nr:hypothetical protein [Myxococcota bacterium]
MRPTPVDRPDEGSEETESRAELWILPYIEDSSLWPVLIVVMAASAAFLTPVLFYAVYHLKVQAILAALLLLWLTGRAIRWEWRLKGRPGGLAFVLTIVWSSAVAAVIYGLRKGWL